MSSTNKTIKNILLAETHRLKQSSIAEILSEANDGLQLTPEALNELMKNKWFMFLVGQIAELHAILYLAKIEPKRIVVKRKQATKPKKKKAKGRK